LYRDCATRARTAIAHSPVSNADHQMCSARRPAGADLWPGCARPGLRNNQNQNL